jgi:hypothetical protein
MRVRLRFFLISDRYSSVEISMCFSSVVTIRLPPFSVGISASSLIVFLFSEIHSPKVERVRENMPIRGDWKGWLRRVVPLADLECSALVRNVST